MKRLVSLLVVSALLFVAVASVASAGGWAVVTLDALPVGVVVDQPVKVGMMIRQHGRTAWICADCVKVRGFHQTGDTFVVNAQMDGKGHYTANLNFNKAGKWQWAVASGLMPEWQTMPDIEVANSANDEVLLAEANTANNSATPTLQTMMPSMLLLALGVLGFVGSAGGLIFWLRSRK
jgi:hypothetical protein